MTIPSFISNFFVKKPRTAPYKLWCFYPEPYKRGLGTTVIIASTILLVVTLIFLIGGLGFLFLSLIGIIAYILFLGLMLIVVGLGIGLLFDNSDDSNVGCFVIIIGLGVAYGIFNKWIHNVSEFADSMFSNAASVYSYLSQPFNMTLACIYDFWPGILGFIFAPVILVFLIAGIFIATAYILRGFEYLLLKINKVGLLCPVCLEPSEPAVYSCPSCSFEHNVVLLPGKYGIFKHNCANCSTSLPTMQLLGRIKNIPRRCPDPTCGVQLTGTVGSDKHIAFVGGRASGKTCLLVQATKYLMDKPGSEIVEEEHRREFKRLAAMIDKGQVPPQTQRINIYRAFQIEFPHKPYPYHIHFYDIAGENFEHSFDASSYHFFKNLNSILFLLDPYSIKSFREKYPPPKGTVFGSQDPLEILENLEQALLKYTSKKRIQKIRFNVVMVKTDTHYLDSHINMGLNEQEVNNRIEEFIRTELSSEAFIYQVHQLFKEVEYYYISSLGRTPSNTDSSPFQPVNLSSSLKNIFDKLNVKVQ